ncbi:MAG: ammonia-forming cytochrome c nitrite reductase subunit c552 [Ignavibacteriales bacterium]|nr:ammonia-forming cytochrome c nitrite reductase subunit c552 [Ignavibacteriales bacterium]MCB9219526.1 ammonia-forming cytochrome c nitrite reductase subunit c552 [Ignavibacteriales bacterium]MCB9257871.1 ammonia-forming cytochrome c nitrite reductase subunit c552 [Ignavibacteriales bacterium]
MLKKLTLTMLICFLSISLVNSQTIEIKPYGVSARTVEADTNDIFDLKYNGLANVGVGTKIYLAGMAVDTTFNSPSWSITAQPAGSTVSILANEDLNETTKIIALIPDVAGTYKIEFTDGGLTSEIAINAALYMGMPSAGLSCGTCHSETQALWEGTGHANAVQPYTDDPTGHFQNRCMGCHTTGYDENATNDGFDDFDFVFPATLAEGNYDALVTNYPDAMQRANVQCEACHGPGSNHNGQTADSKMVMAQTIATCAYCHDAGTHHAIPASFVESGLDATEFDGRGFHGGHQVGAFVQSAGTRNGCSPCHSGAGYVQWIKEGRPSDGLGLPAATTDLPDATNFNCVTCHDPHNAENPYQLRAKETTLGDGTVISFEKYGTGAQCMDCHRSRRQASTYAEDISNGSAHFGAHHGPQGDMLLGKNAPDYGIEFPSSPHGVAGGNACVDCHMAGESAFDAEGNLLNFGGHTFNMNNEEGEDNVEACAPCHGEVGESFKEKKFYINGNADLDGDGTAEGLQEEVHGLLEELAQYLPKDNNGVVLIQSSANFENAADDSLTPRIMRAGYVYFFVEEDRSMGIHNPQFTVAMLDAAIKELDGTTGINYENNQLPSEYKLSQNYPNPFNPTTVINFSIPESGNVKITVYDAIGREIAQLVNKEMQAGNYNIDWNAVNNAAGIYFYRIETNNFVATKKMVLLK